MGGRQNRDIGRDHRSVADVDMRIVDERAVGIDVDVFSQMDIASAPRGIVGRLNIGVLARFREELAQNAGLFFKPLCVYPAAL